MIVYFLSLISTFFFISCYEKNKENKILKIIFFIFSFMPFFLISAFRYDVGTDFLTRYVADFYKINEGLNVDNLEVGYKIIIKICQFFTDNSQSIFIVTSFIINLLITYTIFKYSKNKYLSVIVYFFGGFLFLSLNAVRQFLAMSLIFWAYPYLIRENKKWLYIISVLIASSIHSSALVMLIFAFFGKNKTINYKITLLVVVLFLLFGRSLLVPLNLLLKETKFSPYLVEYYAKADVSSLYLLSNFLIYTFYSLVIKNKNIENKEVILLYNIQAMALIITSMEAIHQLFSRIVFYYTIFQLISIPLFIKLGLNFNLKFSRIKFLDKKYITIYIIIGYIFMFVFTNVIHNDNEVLPYICIFNKNLVIK